MNELILNRATWKDYQRFVDLCCVPTFPFHGGPCWIVEGDIAFVGYNYCFWNCGTRLKLFPEHVVNKRRIDVQWLNQNFRCLNRVMVRPSHRGKGIATQLVRQTLPIVGVKFVECLTFSNLIKGVLSRCEFTNHGPVKSGTCDYFLWKKEDAGSHQSDS